MSLLLHYSMEEPPIIKVLYLDDEEQNLQSFKANFRRNYRIFTTTDPFEAERIIATQGIGVVLADQKMPVKTGVQFFEEIRQKYPDVVRILLTAYTDIGAAISAINKGEVFRFVDKPWDYDYVVTAINEAFEIFNNRQQLREKNIALQKAYEELDHFVYSASHDLRAPLMSILGLIKLADREQDLDTNMMYLKMIEQSVVKVDSYITSIIDYYRNTRNESVIQEVDFKEIVHDCIGTLKYLPESDKIDFELEIEQNQVFFSDSVKLRIIFNNLLSNAIKFQDSSKTDRKVWVNVKVAGSEAVIRIEDNGVGIDEEILPNIFKLFYKGRGAATGTGVGLYIVEEAISKLKGIIACNSQAGNGTAFIITIPDSPNENT